MRKQVEIFTDGACSGNPGAGGWGAVLRFGRHEKELSGGEMQTTNNRMELTAVIMALSALKEPCTVTITTDSKYVADAVSKGWVYGWQKKNWMRLLRLRLYDRLPRPEPRAPLAGALPRGRARLAAPHDHRLDHPRRRRADHRGGQIGRGTHPRDVPAVGGYPNR